MDLRGNAGGNSEILNPFQDLVRYKKLNGVLLIDSGVFSPVVVLFNSELFSTILHIEEKNQEEEPQSAKRNELCPCGSGLKYKKCCGKN